MIYAVLSHFQICCSLRGFFRQISIPKILEFTKKWFFPSHHSTLFARTVQPLWQELFKTPCLYNACGAHWRKSNFHTAPLARSIRVPINPITMCRPYMGGLSQDVKRLNMQDFYPLFFGFSWPFTFALLKITMCFKQQEASHILPWDGWY